MWDQGEGPSRLRSAPALGGLAQKLRREGHSFPRAERCQRRRKVSEPTSTHPVSEPLRPFILNLL